MIDYRIKISYQTGDSFSSRDTNRVFRINMEKC